MITQFLVVGTNPSFINDCSIFLEIAREYTFGELTNDFLADHNFRAKHKTLPDFWIRKVDPEQNCVTQTHAWWELQDSKVKLRDVFPEVEGQETRRIELIARQSEYVMALIGENEMEKWHPVGAPD
jgi:hypothetical protein